MRPFRLAAVSCLAFASLAVGQASAEPVYGLTNPSVLGSTVLVSFDSATPNVMTIVGPISGVVAGQTLQAIDFRPANGLLYAVSSSNAAGQLYTINLTTGALSTVGSGFALTGNTSSAVSIDFNPVVDRLRIVTGSGQNYRINPINGTLVAQDTSITTNALIGDIAYTNNVAGATSTTLYGYDYVTDQLDTIGSVNGTPVSPNSGQLFVVGDSGLLSGSPLTGFDISGVTGIAYASVFDDGSSSAVSGFYRVDLTTGLHTLIGAEAFDLIDFSVRTAAVAAVPEPDSLAMLGIGFAALAGTLRRRARRA